MAPVKNISMEKISFSIIMVKTCQEHQRQEGSSSGFCIQHLIMLLLTCSCSYFHNFLSESCLIHDDDDGERVRETSAKSGKPMKLQ